MSRGLTPAAYVLVEHLDAALWVCGQPVLLRAGARGMGANLAALGCGGRVDHALSIWGGYLRVALQARSLATDDHAPRIRHGVAGQVDFELAVPVAAVLELGQ